MTFRRCCLAVAIAVCNLMLIKGNCAVGPMIDLSQLHISQAILWTPSEGVSLECIITNSSGNTAPRIVIYKNINDRWVELFTEVTGDNIISAFPASDQSPRLITVWDTGSGIMTRVFMYNKNNVKLVLEAGSRSPPEFVYQNRVINDVPTRGNKNPAEREIIVPNEQWLNDPTTHASVLKTTSANIYWWDGAKYEVTRNVPWAKRFNTSN